jgi:transcriptional regulator with XRE-family HTH domain
MSAKFNNIRPSMGDKYLINAKNTYICNRQLTRFQVGLVVRKEARGYLCRKITTIMTMILSEKIMSLRKEAGWSQEELADKLDVSRQSVSKWESSQSIPDMDKIVKMSELFGVSTDYLLKENVERKESSTKIIQEKTYEGKTVTMETADDYLKSSYKYANWTGAIFFLCIGSMAGCIIHEYSSEIIGNITLFLLLTLAVCISIFVWGKDQKYKWIGYEKLHLMYGVEAAVLRKKEKFDETKVWFIVAGVLICILGVTICYGSGAIGLQDSTNVLPYYLIMVFSIACGVFLFARTGKISSSFNRLLSINVGDSYRNRHMAQIYWGTTTLIYLALTITFITSAWKSTWIIWPLAGVLFPVLKALKRK